MTNRFSVALIAGIAASVVMTVSGLMAPYLGLPKMIPAEMLSSMMSVPIMFGWIMHVTIGIVLALAYVYWFNPTVKSNSKFWKGMMFGLAVFVVAQILIEMMLPMPMKEGNMMLITVGSFIGHLIYALVVAWIVPLHLRTSAESNQKRRK